MRAWLDARSFGVPSTLAIADPIVDRAGQISGSSTDAVSSRVEAGANGDAGHRRGRSATMRAMAASTDGASTGSPEGGVDVSRQGPVTIVTICRPERRNAVDSVAAALLLETFVAFEEDPDASVAVLTGRGGSFCAGADLRALADGDHRPIRLEGPGPMGPTRLDLSKPVIAAIEGPAVAGGLELALWCDLRVAATDAVLGVYCRRFGVPLCDGGTVRLARLVGHSRAMDLVLTGRGVSGAEALALGLVNRLSRPGDALERSLDLARALAALPQTCMRNDRRSLIDQWGLDEAAALRHEAELARQTVASGESQQGATRFASGAGRHGGQVHGIS
jgi:enoyl-CoA hydratase